MIRIFFRARRGRFGAGDGGERYARCVRAAACEGTRHAGLRRGEAAARRSLAGSNRSADGDDRYSGRSLRIARTFAQTAGLRKREASARRRLRRRTACTNLTRSRSLRSARRRKSCGPSQGRSCDPPIAAPSNHAAPREPALGMKLRPADPMRDRTMRRRANRPFPSEAADFFATADKNNIKIAKFAGCHAKNEHKNIHPCTELIPAARFGSQT